MTRLTILYDVDGWAYHHNARALQKYAPPDFEVSIGIYDPDVAGDPVLGSTPPDIIYLYPYWEAPDLRVALDVRGWRSKLVAIVNTGWPDKSEQFHAVYRSCDLIFINNTEAWQRLGALKKTVLNPNGVDLDTFQLVRPLSARLPKVIWMGSEILRGLKGYESVLMPVRKALHSQGVTCELLLVDSFGTSKRSHAEMARWYNDATVYLCASRTEGTPNGVLEAAACGCAIVSTRVGNMPELIRNGVNGYLVDRTPQAMLQGIEAALADYPRLAGQMLQDIQYWGWERSAAAFYNTLRNYFGGGEVTAIAAKDSRLDLGSQVTVFVTTVGGPSYDACRLYLDEQDCRFRIKVIEYVAPMSAAFQRMLDECDTPYYIQVDEDMLLYPNAIRSLVRNIENQAPETAVFVGLLHDVHLGREIEGVKIFRHAIVKQYPLRDVPGCEVDQIARFQVDGFRVAGRQGAINPERDIFGLHDACRIPMSTYERYTTLEYLRRLGKHNLSWLDDYFPQFLERFRDEPTEGNFFALMGLLAGSLLNVPRGLGEKDFRFYEQYAGFSELRQFWSAVTRYKRPARYPMEFAVGHDDLQYGTGRAQRGLQVCHPNLDTPGHCIYGPYLRIAGDQVLQACFHVTVGAMRDGATPLATLDVYDNTSGTILAMQDIEPAAVTGSDQIFGIEFQGHRGQVLEFRVFWHGHCELAVHRIVLEPPAGIASSVPAP